MRKRSDREWALQDDYATYESTEGVQPVFFVPVFLLAKQLV
jgi:hypothetical protein